MLASWTYSCSFPIAKQPIGCDPKTDKLSDIKNLNYELNFFYFSFARQQEAMLTVTNVTKDPTALPQASEELIAESKTSYNLYPESPTHSNSQGCSNSLGSRKSSVCSISSMNSSGSSGSPGHQFQRSLSQVRILCNCVSAPLYRLNYSFILGVTEHFFIILFCRLGMGTWYLHIFLRCSKLFYKSSLKNIIYRYFFYVWTTTAHVDSTTIVLSACFCFFSY